MMFTLGYASHWSHNLSHILNWILSILSVPLPTKQLTISMIGCSGTGLLVGLSCINGKIAPFIYVMRESGLQRCMYISSDESGILLIQLNTEKERNTVPSVNCLNQNLHFSPQPQSVHFTTWRRAWYKALQTTYLHTWVPLLGSGVVAAVVVTLAVTLG